METAPEMDKNTVQEQKQDLVQEEKHVEGSRSLGKRHRRSGDDEVAENIESSELQEQELLPPDTTFARQALCV